MFEFFTERAIEAIVLAQEESRNAGHNYLGVEQILMGLIKLSDGVAFDSLKKFDVTIGKTRSAVEQIVPNGTDIVGEEIPFTARSKRVLELSWDEARLLRHNYIGTEHLLLGIVREGEGIAVSVLWGLGVDFIGLRHAVLERQAELFRAQVANDPSNMRAFGSLARSLFFLQRYPEANDYYSKALQLPGGEFYKADASACQQSLNTMVPTDSEAT
jgi:ATP-dependent Clp protease ATP-binding subunit ClpA